MGTKVIIGKFDGEWDFLSNFYEHPVLFKGILYPSSEHAYQAAKAQSEELHEKIRRAKSPGMAKRLGQNVRTSSDWDNRRLPTMRAILDAKFEDPELRGKLMATGEATLIEGNDWGDTFWGVCGGKGKNHLGNLLMELRGKIVSAKK